MRDDDNSSISSFPALGSPGPRICPNCERPIQHRPREQRCCSSKCAFEWRRAQRPKTGPRPRFNFVQGVTANSNDPSDIDDEDTAWASRGAYWESVIDSVRHAPSRSTTLTLAGHGALLRVDGNVLVVRNGFTHYPQVRREVRYTPRHPRLPARIVLLNCDGAVSMPALSWLARQSVPVVLLDWRGNIAATLAAPSTRFGDPELNRRLAALTDVQRTDLGRFLIKRKVEAQVATVGNFPPSINRAETRLRIEKELVYLSKTVKVEEIRMAEARAAVWYFRLWTRLPIRWKGLSRRPVPPEWLSIRLRGSAIGDTNRWASHPTNALLNYAYGVLHSQVAIVCASLGIDATAGILHARREGRAALVLDLMEPMRPIVDARIVELIGSHTFSRTDFPIGRDGICRLHPQLARVVAQLATLPGRIVELALQSFIAKLQGSNGLRPERALGVRG